MVRKILPVFLAILLISCNKGNPADIGNVSVLDFEDPKNIETVLDGELFFKYPRIQNAKPHRKIPEKGRSLLGLRKEEKSGRTILTFVQYGKNELSIPENLEPMDVDGAESAGELMQEGDKTLERHFYIAKGNLIFVLSELSECFSASCVEGFEEEGETPYEQSLQYVYDSIVDTISFQ